MFSKGCEYAIRIMSYLATKKEEDILLVGLEDIVSEIDSPRAFTAKILQQLVRAKLLVSVRGRNGGFSIPNGKSITLADIVIAIDGDQLLKGCLLGFSECSEEHPCPVHHKLTPAREQMKRTLNETSLEELQQLLEKNLAFLNDL